MFFSAHFVPVDFVLHPVAALPGEVVPGLHQMAAALPVPVEPLAGRGELALLPLLPPAPRHQVELLPVAAKRRRGRLGLKRCLPALTTDL